MTRARDLADFNLDGKAVTINESSADLDFRVESNGDANMLFVDGGNDSIGIGTSTPTTYGDSNTKLAVVTPTSNADDVNIRFGTNDVKGIIFVNDVSGDGVGFGTTTDDGIQFNTNNTSRMTISNGGYSAFGGSAVIVGAVGASHSMHGFAGTGAWALGLQQNTTSAGGGRVLGLRNVTDFNNTDNPVLYYTGNTTLRFQVTSNGNVYNTNNSYNAISDQKLKEQITDAASQWDDVKALQIRKYKMKDEVIAQGDSDDLWRLGVVAQELETAGMSGLVDEITDFDENGEDAGTVTKNVKYSILYIKAVKALQEAMTRIETLETEMTALKARVTTLEGE